MSCFGILLVCLALQGMLLAQTPHGQLQIEERTEKGCSGVYYSGDKISCVVVFDGDPEFSHLELVFNLERQPAPNTPGKYLSFVLRESHKIERGAYEASGIVDECYTGTYVLAAISAGVGEKGYRLYSNKYQFHSGLKVEFVNNAPKPTEAPREVQPEELVLPITKPLVPIDEEELEREAAERKRAVGVPTVKESPKGLCGGVHKPGDEMECVVSFSGEPKFYSVLLSFGLRTQTRGDQGGMCNGVLLQKSEKVDANTFLVSGPVPWCASGKYQVNEVMASEMRWSSFNGERVDGNVVMYLRNEDSNLFPEVKAVEPKRLE
jgi:hypothetical protein